jgi:hypothetical protein
MRLRLNRTGRPANEYRTPYVKCDRLSRGIPREAQAVDALRRELEARQRAFDVRTASEYVALPVSAASEIAMWL